MSESLGKIKSIVFEYENGTVSYVGADAESVKRQIDSAFTLADIHGCGYTPPVPVITINQE